MDPGSEALSSASSARESSPALRRANVLVPRPLAASEPEREPDPEWRPAPATPHAEFRARTRFAALDGLRALSILAVLWHHTAAGLGALPASHNGFLGVDMFFVLSGFLIVTLLVRERERTGAISLRGFYARRVLRIFPIYYLVLGAVLLFVTVVRPGSSMRAPFLAELPFHLTYTSNWFQTSTFLAITWSLAAEEQFYLLWPPIEKFFARWVGALLLGVLVLNQLLNFGLLDRILANSFGMHPADYAILQITFTPICLGVVLAHGLADARVFARMHAVLARPWAPWLLLAVLAALVNVPGSLSGLPRLSIQVAMTLLLAACVLEEKHVLARLLARPALVRIGVISYGMYLYHPFARHGAQAVERALGVASPLLLFVLCTLLTLVLAEVSFRLLERPLSGLRRFIPAQRAPARVRADADARLGTASQERSMIDA